MANTGSRYTYRRFSDSREIRLIRLTHNEADDVLSAVIENVSIDTNPDFVALSYVWGPQEPSTPILFGKSELRIGLNLDRVLRLLVRQGWSDKLYVDRLSIDQDSLDERAQQVLLMGEIFGKAKMVLVWLGDATSNTKLAFETISSLAKDLLQRQKESGNSAERPHDIQYPVFENPAAAAIRQILNMPWFTRVWTFQEIVLARSAVLKCGDYHMPWSHLETLLVGMELYRPGQEVGRSFLRGSEDAAFEMTKNRVYRRDPDLYDLATGPANVSLIALLHELRKRQATDPRDKVYALLNVAIDVFSNDLRPDYHLSHLEVYAMTCKWLLARYRNLAFLSLVEKKDKPDLVSWVPDFRSKDDFNFMHQARLIFRPTQVIWRASGSAIARESPMTTPLLHMPVHAIRIGKVVAMTDPPGNLVGNVALGTKVLEGGQWEHFASAAAENGIYTLTGEPIDLAFQRIRMWDVRPGEGNRRRSRQKPLTLADIPKLPDLLEAVTSIENLDRWHFNDIASRILNSTTRKRLVRTETGYLGLARRCVDLGDELFILMGFDVPCVMRKIGGQFYSFGGEAYVHGAMDGEPLLRLAGRRSSMGPIGFIEPDDMQWLESLEAHGDKRLFPVVDMTIV